MSQPQPGARELAALTDAWLESLRERTPPPLPCAPPLEAALLADRLFQLTREREGIVRFPGELSVERVEVPAQPGAVVTVDVAARIDFPGEDLRDGSRAVDPAYKVPSFPATTVEIGPVDFQRGPGGWLLSDWTVGGRAMSASWCTHPSGEAATGGFAAVAQAVRSGTTATARSTSRSATAPTPTSSSRSAGRRVPGRRPA